ncbi:GDSL lipase/esterase [Coniella lustricola]|uniref:GDSL lipase/esterase n=1 Tax=Coniella lustricola TaxID=2025994 RepID=A0A2T2ZSL6_9PEZI|nr:GDSL lipase/esterase [Coniella lustricola]
MRVVRICLLLQQLSVLALAALTGSATLSNFSSLVIFGDSYTDDGIHAYTPEPDANLTTDSPDGGRPWSEYIQQYTGVKLYDYAVSGAVCDAVFSPSVRSGVKQNQVPQFLADQAYGGNASLVDAADETIYAIWIGTNDLGPGKSHRKTVSDAASPIVDYIHCIYEQLDVLYAAGARNFVLLNIAPLNFAPMYALAENGGVIDSHYWLNEDQYSTNVTLVSEKMREYVALVNQVYDYQSPFQILVSDRYPASTFTIYNVHDLLSDIWHNPSDYLNGTVPYNVTSYITACGSACDSDAVRDSYMWYDSLHPSEQTDRILAREFVNMVDGNGTWSQTWTSPSASS